MSTKWCLCFLICCLYSGCSSDHIHLSPFNVLNGFVIDFLPCHNFSSMEQMSFNSMAAVPIHSDFGAQENKICYCLCFPPSVCHEVMGPDAMILDFWMLSFKTVFSLFSFTFIKRLFSPSSLSAIRVMSLAYLRLLIFLLAILIPACASSSLRVSMMYTAYKLNKHVDNIQPCCTPFPILNQSVVPCLVLTAVCWPAYRRQVRWSGIPITWRIFQFVVTHSKALV